ncbi:MAG: hypothetical protein ACR2PZ_15490 [Pseudomonadales bacterium]
MKTPAIAHFGTTIVESAPAAGVRQQDVPVAGVLGDMLAFLDVLGFEPGVENYYEGVGRQYIWHRGSVEDVDYVEQDNFTSYVAQRRPTTTGPRVGDTIFRLSHADPQSVYQALIARSLVKAVNGDRAAAFIAGEQDWLLIEAPNAQIYELGRTGLAAADNHVIYVWTEIARLDEVAQSYATHFGVKRGNVEDFHDLGKVLYLRREEPGLTIGLMHDPVQTLAPRWTDDIFKEAGYAHFRLGAVSKSETEQTTRQAFPAAGDVSFVYFEDSYLELVQA